MALTYVSRHCQSTSHVGLAPLSLLPLVPHFRANISSCWIAIVYLLHYLKLLTYGRKPILPDSRWVLRRPRKMPHPLLQHQRFQHDCYVKDTREGTSHQTVGQGVVLVTEPHAELNAGVCWPLRL